MTIGARIKELRLKNNMMQVDLAKAVNSSKQTIYKYENDIVTNIPYDKIILLAKALNTTTAYLMGWEDDLPSYPGIMPVEKSVSPSSVKSLAESRSMPMKNIMYIWNPIAPSKPISASAARETA